MVTAAAARPNGQRVLVVEDEADLRDLLSYNLQAAGYDVRAVETGERALSELPEFQPNLLILDLMLPGISGTEVCRRTRTNPRLEQPAIIMLTAKSDEIDRVVGFEVGADDYVIKPCSMRELVLRVGAVLRRSEAARANKERNSSWEPSSRRALAAGPIRVDVDGHRVFVHDEEVHVSGLEMRLLAYLLEGRGRVRTREDLLRDVWGYRAGVSTRTVDTHVKRLRDKLGTEGGDLIETVRGVGYRFSD